MADVTVETLDNGAFWRVTFSNGHGNILDRQMMRGLAEVFRKAKASPALKAISLAGAGRHFSFGASVQEHLPGEVEGMFDAFRDLVFALIDADVVTMAAVKGQCLGGGLEVATLCHRIEAGADAKFAQPEIALGVFAPVASIALVDRIGRRHAEDLCLSGRTIDSREAHAMGLVNAIHDDPASAAIEWAQAHLGPHSASSLRHAVHALRADLARRVHTELPALEAQYLQALMKTADAVEGLTAFIEKRPATWRHA